MMNATTKVQYVQRARGDQLRGRTNCQDLFFKEQQTRYHVPHSDEECGTLRKMQKWLKQ